MKQLLQNGCWVMAAYEDIKCFFEEHKVIGRVIRDILPKELDYMIRNLEDIENITSYNIDSAIDTDGVICILFEDGDSMEIEVAGEGPIILGWNTADLAEYPNYDGSCYKISTMFQHCIGKQITDVIIPKTEGEIRFPCYCGIDMSEDDEGIKEIRIYLEDHTYLQASGSIDWFCLEHCMENGEPIQKVPYKEVLQELNEEIIVALWGMNKKTFLGT